jgi:hypothetical protein
MVTRALGLDSLGYSVQLTLADLGLRVVGGPFHVRVNT